MFKLIVLVECDICGELFDRIATSADRDPAAWENLPAILEARAESSSWHVYSAHYCYDCVSAMAGES